MNFLSEGLWPSLERAFAPLGLDGATGLPGDLRLHGPLHLVTATHADASPPPPIWLQPYHLCSPITVIPLDALRKCQTWPPRGWIEERGQRALFTLPLIVGEEPGGNWRANKSEIIYRLGTKNLLLFLPHPDVMEKSFADFTGADLARCATAMWDITTGKVLYADGVHSSEGMLAAGLPLKEWAKIPEQDGA